MPCAKLSAGLTGRPLSRKPRTCDASHPLAYPHTAKGENGRHSCGAGMHERNVHSPSSSAAFSAGKESITAAELMRRQARRLHRAALSGSIAPSLPALRRVHAADIIPDRPLSVLYRERQGLKRKHFLRALAVEAGFPDWERFRSHLGQMPPESFDHFKVVDEWFVFLSAWFSNEEQAHAFARQHGGRMLRVGSQAVVVSPDSQVEAPARSGS